MKIQTIHTADTHLRLTQYGKLFRGQDFLDTMLETIQAAKDRGIRDILHCGDFLDTTRPPADIIINTMGQVERALEDAGVRMHLISGNHDLTEPTWWKIHDRPNKTAGIIPADDKRFDVGGFSVLAVRYRPKDALLAYLQEADPADILMCHAPIIEFAGTRLGSGAVSLADFPKGKFKLVLLGDIHKAGVIELDGTTYAMPGSTELTKDNEDPDKTVFVHTLDNTNGFTVSTETITLSARPVVKRHLATEEDVVQLLADLAKAALAPKLPLVSITHAEKLDQVRARIYAVIDPAKTHVRCQSIPEDLAGVIGENTEADDLRPADLLHLYIDETDAALMELGQALLNPHGEPKDAFKRYSDAMGLA